MSEANVCSVDMDEMSLIDDDWEGLVLLFTAASVLRKPNIIKSEARQYYSHKYPRFWAVSSSFPTEILRKSRN